MKFWEVSENTNGYLGNNPLSKTLLDVDETVTTMILLNKRTMRWNSYFFNELIKIIN